MANGASLEYSIVSIRKTLKAVSYWTLIRFTRSNNSSLLILMDSRRTAFISAREGQSLRSLPLLRERAPISDRLFR